MKEMGFTYIATEEDCYVSNHIFNLTQHQATPEQIAQGLVEPDAETKKEIQDLLTFTAADIQADKVAERAEALVELLQEHWNVSANCRFDKRVLIGGLPAMMRPLVNILENKNYIPMFAHSDRVSVDQPQADGSVKKVAVFQHQFFYPAP